MDFVIQASSYDLTFAHKGDGTYFILRFDFSPFHVLTGTANCQWGCLSPSDYRYAPIVIAGESATTAFGGEKNDVS